MKRFPLVSASLTLFALLTLRSAAAGAESPTVKQMLELKPTQRWVEYDTPRADKLAGLKPEVVTEGKAKGWVLREPGGKPYRKFMDTNKDNVVDLWIYFQDGVEVYRDIDSNFNGRADQFRWMNSGGTRWAVDSNEDGRIDAYRVISAEETTREFLRALVQREFAAAEPLLVRPADARELIGVVTPEHAKEAYGQARDQFNGIASKLTRLTADSQWLRFEGGVPALVPGDAPDGSRDVSMYRGALVVIQTGDDIDVLRFGEIVQVGRAWKLTELPTVVAPNATIAARANATFANVPPEAETPEPDQPNSQIQTLIAKLASLDEEAAKSAGPAATSAKYHIERADVLAKIVDAAEAGQDRAEWQRQLADSLIAALQIEASQDAADRLTRLAESARNDENNTTLAAYVAFRRISADYTRSMQAPNADFEAIQKAWLEQLDKFVADFPTADDAAEAFAQLGVGMEFTGKDEQAREYYQKLVDSFPKSTAARRAAGAIRRLAIVGKPLAFQASDLRRGTVDTKKLEGKIVLIDFWATTCDPWKNDLPRLKEIYAKYRGKGFEIVGVSLDNDKAEVNRFAQSSGISWPIAFETGGLDSVPALDYGIIALPTQFLIGPDGKVASRSVHISQLEEQIRKLLKSKD